MRRGAGMCAAQPRWVPVTGMTDHDRAIRRAAHLLPEEQDVGSDDPLAQADAILADSDRRQDVGAAPDTFVEHRTSDQTVMPPDVG